MPRFRSRRILQIIVLLLVGVMLWAAWYGAKRGLTRNWRERVFAEFRAQGIEITFKKLTADALHLPAQNALGEVDGEEAVVGRGVGG